MRDKVTNLRKASRKLVRELGLIQFSTLDDSDSLHHKHCLIEISLDKDITISKISHLLLISISTGSRLITNLVEDGLVEYQLSSDRREKKLKLTEKGLARMKEIDEFSNAKIRGAFDFMTESDQDKLLESITHYSEALEKYRHISENIKIFTLSKSNTIRKQIVSMIESIQICEFAINITPEINECIFKAEDSFYFNNSYNFWYATNDKGEVIGSIGLKKINSSCGEVKKFFVKKEYRGKNVAQTLKNAAAKHNFKYLYLGTVDVLKAAHKFYEKSGFNLITKKELPKEFDICYLDNVFYMGELR